MVTWLIREYMIECPLGWQRFIDDLQRRLPFDSRDGFSIGTINQELAVFRANFYESGRNSFVDFTSEKCYNLFVLKYGGKQ